MAAAASAAAQNNPAIMTLSAGLSAMSPAVWKLSPGSAEKQLRLRQSFQSA